MAYKNKFGITKINKEIYYNLSISWDYIENPKNKKDRYPVFLFKPIADQSNHYHIRLDRKQAKVLNTWLTKYLKDI